MNTMLVVAAFVVMIGIFLFTSKKGDKDNDNKNRPVRKIFPAGEKNNDKLVVIRGVAAEVTKNIVKDFCDLYNEKEFVAIPRLIVFEDCQAVIFPYDIDFERFCYFVNYVRYGRKRSLPKPDVTGWCSTKQGDKWMTNEIVNKKVMLFIPDSDDEYDNVFLTTEDNLGFKMGFAGGDEHIKLKTTILQYKASPLIEVINNNNAIEVINLK